MSHGYVQREDGRVEHPFEPLVLALALLVIPVVLLDQSYPHGVWHTVATIGNWGIWLGFALEMVLILSVAHRRLAALRVHWLESVVTVLTFPLLGQALAGFRLLRLLRLARVGMLGALALRTEKSLASRHAFRYLAIVTALVVVIAGFGIAIVDTKDFHSTGDGIWWSIVTVTTVGYGDLSPTTTGGRIVAGLLMIVGIGFISVFTATIASTFVATDASESVSQEQILAALERIEARLDRIEGSGS